MQLARLAALGHQAVFGCFQRALQVALHRGHVVHRLRHHAGDFLHTGEAVELQRIERLIGIARLRQARLHLRLGLQLHVAQLRPQAIQVAGELFERTAQDHQLGFHATAADHHLTRLVDHAVE